MTYFVRTMCQRRVYATITIRQVSDYHLVYYHYKVRHVSHLIKIWISNAIINIDSKKRGNFTFDPIHFSSRKWRTFRIDFAFWEKRETLGKPSLDLCMKGKRSFATFGKTSKFRSNISPVLITFAISQYLRFAILSSGIFRQILPYSKFVER